MMDPPRILIADDNKQILEALADVLMAQNYEIVRATDGNEAMKKIVSDEPDVIILDINMPEMTGLEVLSRIKLDKKLEHIPVIIITGQDDITMRVEALKLGADDLLLKPPLMAELKARVKTLVKVKAYNDYMKKTRNLLEAEVHKRIEELSTIHEKLRTASLDTIFLLSRASEYKDKDTSEHIQRMSHYTAALARETGFSPERAEVLLYSSSMHDIGKMGIPDRILLKPGKLTDDEWELMKQHTTIGAGILDSPNNDFIRTGKIIALTHHEKWDGTGYPQGLKGEAIPVEGRISAIADVYDALTTKRPYKEAFDNETAFSIIVKDSGSHFDPELIESFLNIKEEILQIQKTFGNEYRKRLVTELTDNV